MNADQDLQKRKAAGLRASEAEGSPAVSPDVAPGEEQPVAALSERARASGGGILTLFKRAFRLSLQVALPVLVLAAAFAGYQYMKATKPEAKKGKIREAVYAVRSVPAVFETITPKLTLYGATVAGRQVELRSLVAGRVIETGDGLRDGGIVSAGDMLLRIDRFDFKARLDEAKAQLAEARAKLSEMKASLETEKSNLAFSREQLQLGQADLERARPLARRGAVSDRTVDERRLVVVQRRQAAAQLENSISVWSARIAQQQAVISRLESAESQAKRRLDETVLNAPFEAYVASIGAQVGRMLNVNDSVATLIDRNWIEARFTLTNEQFGRLVGQDQDLAGRKVQVVWQVGTRALAYPARIERIGARVTSSSGGVDVFARLSDPKSPVPIRPGVFVSIALEDAKFENVARVTSSAVYDGKRVFVISDGRLVGRDVQIVGTAGDDLLLQGKLKPGERIVTTRLSAPGDGVRVEEIKSRSRGNGA